MNKDIHLRWEKATALGVRYYEVELRRDLWGEWLLAQAWGRRGTRLAKSGWRRAARATRAWRGSQPS